MTQEQLLLGVVVARGGSKRLPGKNLMKICGESLVERTVRIARSSRVISKLIISSDNDAILAEAQNAGCEVLFVRPDHLAQDSSSSIDVLTHAITSVPLHQHTILLQPTSPLRTAEDINNAYNLMLMMKSKSCVSVVKSVQQFEKEDKNFPAERVFKPNGASEFVPSKVANYLLNGALYLVETASFLKTNTFIDEKSIGMEMPKERSLDIDTLTDFELCCTALEA